MLSAFAPIIGRFLLIPVALSGVCLSMLFGVPMAGAMEPTQQVMSIDDLDNHSMTVVEDQGDKTQPGCCTTVRMEHDTEATAPDHGKTSVNFLVADLPREIFSWQIVYLKSAQTTRSYSPPHQPFSLIGTIIKRE
ncbi:hypothetical protein HY733_03120 [Candidatus Uhrbacteria bacterium]|nr:hypothetical protein [Candidatus Uhrbacteria bacterium]